MSIKKPSTQTIQRTGVVVGFAVGVFVAYRGVTHLAAARQRINESVYILSVIERAHPGALDEAIATIAAEIDAAGGNLVIPSTASTVLS